MTHEPALTFRTLSLTLAGALASALAANKSPGIPLSAFRLARSACVGSAAPPARGEASSSGVRVASMWLVRGVGKCGTISVLCYL